MESVGSCLKDEQLFWLCAASDFELILRSTVSLIQRITSTQPRLQVVNQIYQKLNIKTLAVFSSFGY